jgi:hypothetical protein
MSAAVARRRLDPAADSHCCHDCDTCDQQWAPAGKSTACIVHRASRCAGCEGTGEPFRERRTA